MDCEDLQTISSQQDDQYNNDDNFNNNNDNYDNFNNDNDDNFNNDDDDDDNDNDDNFNNDNDDNDNQEDNQSENRVIEKSQKKSHSIQTSSQVWDHFIKASDFKKSKKAICKYCKLSYVCSGGSTSNLLRHLKKQHPAQAGTSIQGITIDEMFSSPKTKVDILFLFIFIIIFHKLLIIYFII
jgi:BED zinc finger